MNGYLLTESLEARIGAYPIKVPVSFSENSMKQFSLV